LPLLRFRPRIQEWVPLLLTPSLDLASLRHAFAEGLSPQDVIELCFARITEAADPGIFIALREKDDILADCRKLGPFDLEKKPLWGVPFAVKDNIDVAGLPTTAACPDFAYSPDESAFAVERLIAAGAILIGKTNLDQFAAGLVGLRTPYPAPRNALDAALVPGGSSSGSAVAVARGIVSFSLGTDTAGSGRVPAALNNIVGLKPSLGLVSTRGVFPACRSLDCVSIFAMSVDDAFDVLKICAGYDVQNAWSRDLPLQEPTRLPAPRIGVPNEAGRIFFGDTDAAKAFDAALKNPVFAKPPLSAHGPAQSGAQIVECDLAPFFAIATLLYGGAFVAERYAAIHDFIESKPEALHPTTRSIIETARNFSAADLFADLDRLAVLKRSAQALWRDIDCLVVPSIPTVVTCDDIAVDPIGPNSKLGTYTNFVNLLDLCALAVPGPFRDDGRPAGVTFIAPAGEDAMIAGLAREFHAHLGLTMGSTGMALRPLPQRPPALPRDMIEILVVGAHMSGLPLNSELVGHGGSFVREAETANSYKLFALPGEAPQRPGLLRIGKDQGRSIAVEVWALPVEAFGRFVASIPSPLSIGNVLLADGSSVKGFLCEPQDLLESRDISHYGGWRAYLAAMAPAHE
jgi:allophanate hydrolase